MAKNLKSEILNLKLFEVNNPSLQRRRRCLGSVGYAELAENVIDMTLHCGFADVQVSANLFIAFSSHDLLQHLELPARKL